jgi:hypothetical protein
VQVDSFLALTGLPVLLASFQRRLFNLYLHSIEELPDSDLCWYSSV